MVARSKERGPAQPWGAQSQLCPIQGLSARPLGETEMEMTHSLPSGNSEITGETDRKTLNQERL